MDISEINRRNENGGPYEWVDPAIVSGLPLPDCSSSEESEELIDLVRYLCACLRENEEARGMPSLNQFISAALFFIKKFKSSFAVTQLSACRFVLTENNFREFLAKMRVEFEGCQDKVVACNFRDLIMDIFMVGFSWNPYQRRFSKFLSDDENNFLQSLVNYKCY